MSCDVETEFNIIYMKVYDHNNTYSNNNLYLIKTNKHLYKTKYDVLLHKEIYVISPKQKINEK